MDSRMEYIIGRNITYSITLAKHILWFVLQNEAKKWKVNRVLEMI